MAKFYVNSHLRGFLLAKSEKKVYNKYCIWIIIVNGTKNVLSTSECCFTTVRDILDHPKLCVVDYKQKRLMFLGIK